MLRAVIWFLTLTLTLILVLVLVLVLVYGHYVAFAGWMDKKRSTTKAGCKNAEKREINEGTFI
ncbi:MAG: hypothetical protein ACNYPH_03660 [Gammaproteobacteria bacterium WSBS_2016_MAG_OTU1]